MVVEIMAFSRYRGQKWEERKIITTPSIFRFQTKLTHETECILTLLTIKEMI